MEFRYTTKSCLVHRLITSIIIIWTLFCVFSIVSVTAAQTDDEDSTPHTSQHTHTYSHTHTHTHTYTYNTKQDTFIPTKEWQVVKKGQPIPKGLHVRVNFETGVTEAKILDPEDNSKSVAVSAVSETDFEKVAEDKSKDYHNYADVKEALKNIKDDYVEKDESKTPSSPFRTYEQLKQDFEDMHIKVKTDFELIKALMLRFPTASDSKKLFVLTDMEYLVHQIDNAREFARLDGFTDIVYPCFNSTNIEIRSEAMKLLGSAVQSNPQVQISALSSGSIQLLLRSIIRDEDVTVRSRAMYALSCLTRSFPAAQIKMVTEGGLAVLAQAFDQEDNKLQVKVVTLIDDLLKERQTIRDLLQDDDQTSEELMLKLEQYESTDLELQVVEASWCNKVPELLLSETANPDNDVVEKVLNALNTLFHVCGNRFRTQRLKTGLYTLENWYRELAKSDEDDYFKSLADNIVNFRSKLASENEEL